MATAEVNMLGTMTQLEAGVFPDLIKNQITTTNKIGEVQCIVLSDGASDVGLHGSFKVPENYASAPVIVIRGVLDGAPSAAHILGFGINGISIDDNEAADASTSSDDLASATIGSNGSNHADEDFFEETIALSNLSVAVGETVYFQFFIDISITDYTGNFLMTDLLFRYTTV